MTTKKPPLRSVEDMVEGKIYAVWYSVPTDDEGASSYRGSFTDMFMALRLGPNKQLFACFKQQDAVDIRHLTWVVEMPWEE